MTNFTCTSEGLSCISEGGLTCAFERLTYTDENLACENKYFTYTNESLTCINKSFTCKNYCLTCTNETLTYSTVEMRVCCAAGTFTIEVFCEGSPVNGSPFNCKAFDSSAIVVGSVPSGMVGKPVEFKGKFVLLQLIMAAPTGMVKANPCALNLHIS